MNLKNNKYIKCFTQQKSAELSEVGFPFLFEKAGVYYHENNEQVIVKFSDDKNLLKDTKYSLYIPI